MYQWKLRPLNLLGTDRYGRTSRWRFTNTGIHYQWNVRSNTGGTPRYRPRAQRMNYIHDPDDSKIQQGGPIYVTIRDASISIISLWMSADAMWVARVVLYAIMDQISLIYGELWDPHCNLEHPERYDRNWNIWDCGTYGKPLAQDFGIHLDHEYSSFLGSWTISASSPGVRSDIPLVVHPGKLKPSSHFMIIIRKIFHVTQFPAMKVMMHDEPRKACHDSPRGVHKNGIKWYQKWYHDTMPFTKIVPIFESENK